MFVFTRWWTTAVAIGALAALLWMAHGLIGAAQRRTRGDDPAVHPRQRGIKSLIIGADGRASTSKVQVVLWTLAVMYAFTFLLLWGRSIGCDGELSDAAERRCRDAAGVRGVFAQVLEEPLETEYYALLGLPTAAAVAAKALTVNKLSRGQIVKQGVSARAKPGVGRGLAEVVSADNGRTDLIDFQYFAFNLLALAYFAFEFTASPAAGLPELPPTLIALTGVAVAAYTGKKALESDAPSVSAVLPRRIRIGKTTSLTVVGTGFGKPIPSAGKLLIEGVRIGVADATWSDRKIEATLEPDALDDLSVPQGGGSVEITVVTPDDAVSPPFTVELAPGDQG